MAESTIFEEDLVCRFNSRRGVQSGLVIESQNSEDDVTDDSEDEELVQKGSIKVAWHPDGNHEIVQESEVKLVDRSLMPGDVVRRLVPGQDSQRGFVTDACVCCHVQIYGIPDKVLYDIDSKDFRWLQVLDFEPCYVTLGAWVGLVEATKKNVTLRFADSARCIVDEEDLMPFCDINERKDEFSEFATTNVFANQELEGQLGDLRHAKWLHSTRSHCSSSTSRSGSKNKHVIVIVEKVKVKEVFIDWKCSGYAGTDLVSHDPPPNNISGSKLSSLKVINCFGHCSVQVGDQLLYTIRPSDDVVTVDSDNKTMIHHILKSTSSKSNSFPVYEESEEKYEEDEEKAITKKDNNSGKNMANNNSLIHHLLESVHNYLSTSEVGALGHDASCSQHSGTSQQNCERLLKVSDEFEPTSECISSGTVTDNMVPCIANVNSDNSQNTDMVGKCDLKKAFDNVDKEESENDDGTIPENHCASGNSEDLVAPSVNPDDDIAKSPDISKNCADNATTTVSDSSIVCNGNKAKYKKHTSKTMPKYTASKRIKGKRSKAIEEVRKNHDPGTEVVVEVLFTMTTVSVLWQDGTEEKNIPSSNLFPVHHLDEHEFFPGDFVQKTLEAGRLMQNADIYGCVTKVNFSERTCYIQWQSPDPLFVGDLEELSVYDIQEHPDYSYRPGNWVVILESENSRTSNNRLPCQEAGGQVYSINSDGVGVLTIKWSDGSTSSLRPYQIFPVAEDTDEYSSGAESQDDDEDDDSWETESEEEIDIADPERGSFVTRHMAGSVLEHILDVNSELFQKVLHHPACQAWNVYDFEKDPLKSKFELCDLIRNLFLIYCINTEPGSSYFTSDKFPPIWDELSAYFELAYREKVKADMESESDETAKMIHGGTPDVKVPVNKIEESRLTEMVSQCMQSLIEQLEMYFKASDDEVIQDCACKHYDSVANTDSIVSDANQTHPLDTDIVKDVEDTLCTLLEGVEMDADNSGMSGVHGVFQLLEDVPSCHHFNNHSASKSSAYMKAAQKDMKLLQTALPSGIIVKAYETRMDLYSVLIFGPAKTPYEDGVFAFDVFLPSEYPHLPPEFYYMSYCTDRLNPNLYENGKVCVSLLGTWNGKGSEMWTEKSSLLQVLISIQGLILVAEPYYNEAGFERQRGSQLGQENSKLYNEMAIIKLLQSMAKLIKNPPEVFKDEIFEHFKLAVPRMIQRYERWIELSNKFREEQKQLAVVDEVSDIAVSPGQISSTSNDSIGGMLEFPLLPASKGFCLSFKNNIARFKDVVKETDLTEKLS